MIAIVLGVILVIPFWLLSPKAARSKSCTDGQHTTSHSLSDSIGTQQTHGQDTRQIIDSSKSENLSSAVKPDSSNKCQRRTAESIIKEIKIKVPLLQELYKEYLAGSKGLKGKISIKFTINPGGDIIAFKVVSSNTGCPRLDEDISKEMRKLKFAEIDCGNTTATYAFVLDEMYPSETNPK